jgi:hypothetical protein
MGSVVYETPFPVNNNVTFLAYLSLLKQPVSVRGSVPPGPLPYVMPKNKT